MSAGEERVRVTLESGIADVLLNRPEKKNALDAGMFEGLLAAADRLEADASVRAVVLSGAGGSFSSGLDVASIGQIADGSLNVESESAAAAAAEFETSAALMGTPNQVESVVARMQKRAPRFSDPR
jgi:enoyl-CoA hydratase/carnithine racemase